MAKLQFKDRKLRINVLTPPHGGFDVVVHLDELRESDAQALVEASAHAQEVIG